MSTTNSTRQKIIGGRNGNLEADVEESYEKRRLLTATSFSDVANTPFNELLTVQRTTIINYKPVFGISILRDKVTTTGSGTITETGGEFLLSTGATVDSSLRLETKERGNYVPGYSFEIGIACRLPVMPTGTQELLLGYFDLKNGYILGVDANGPFTFHRKDGVDSVKTYQQNWNLDKLDGTGPSKAILKWAAGNIFHINATWYGYGNAIFSAYIAVNGVKKMVPFHSMTPPADGVMIQDPNQPVTVRIKNGTGGGNFQAFVGGRQFSVLGPYAPELRTPSEMRQMTISTSSNTPVMAIRLKELMRSRPNSIRSGVFSVAIVTDTDCIVEIWQASTVSGGSWQTPTGWTSSETGVETNVSLTGFTGGVCRKRTISAANQNSGGGGVSLLTNMQGVLLHPLDPVVLSVTRLKNVSVTVQAVVMWWEEW